MSNYEHVFVSRPDISPQQVEGQVEEITNLVTSLGGTIEKTEYWGLRNLAYPINKSRKGHYSLLNITGPSAAIQELERKQRLNEDVMRYMTVRVEEHEEGPSPVLSRKDRGERSERGDRGNDRGGDRFDRGDRPDRGDLGDRPDRGDRRPRD
jgi:small subunit ribosomal protein S6